MASTVRWYLINGVFLLYATCYVVRVGTLENFFNILKTYSISENISLLQINSHDFTTMDICSYTGFVEQWTCISPRYVTCILLPAAYQPCKCSLVRGNADDKVAAMLVGTRLNFEQLRLSKRRRGRKVVAQTIQLQRLGFF